MPVSGRSGAQSYYADGGVTVYNADALEVLAQLGPVAVCLTDPPYNLGIEYGAGVDDERADYAAWCARWFAAVQRIAPTVALTPGIANLGLWHIIVPPDWIVAWHKPGTMKRCHIGFNNWEPILVWGRSVQQTSDVIVAPLQPLEPGLDWHPCPKPIKWATALVAMFSQPGDTILDPFMGSGTTMRAARDLGRRYIGIEVNEAYCERAVRRLDQGVLDVAV